MFLKHLGVSCKGRAQNVLVGRGGNENKEVGFHYSNNLIHQSEIRFSTVGLGGGHETKYLYELLNIKDMA